MAGKMAAAATIAAELVYGAVRNIAECENYGQLDPGNSWGDAMERSAQCAADTSMDSLNSYANLMCRAEHKRDCGRGDASPGLAMITDMFGFAFDGDNLGPRTYSPIDVINAFIITAFDNAAVFLGGVALEVGTAMLNSGTTCHPASSTLERFFLEPLLGFVAALPFPPHLPPVKVITSRTESK